MQVMTDGRQLAAVAFTIKFLLDRPALRVTMGSCRYPDLRMLAEDAARLQ